MGLWASFMSQSSSIIHAYLKHPCHLTACRKGGWLENQHQHSLHTAGFYSSRHGHRNNQGGSSEGPGATQGLRVLEKWPSCLFASRQRAPRWLSSLLRMCRVWGGRITPDAQARTLHPQWL